MTLKKRPTRRQAESRQQIGMRVYPSLMTRVRDACYWESITVVRFIDDALTAHLARMERKRGEPYPPREEELKAGRPVT